MDSQLSSHTSAAAHEWQQKLLRLLPSKTPLVLILRGISGSGKSSVARAIVSAHPPGTVAVCSADDFFLQGGVYRFDFNQLGAAHEACRRSFDSALRRRIPIIILDNTNTTLREYEPYVSAVISFNDAVAGRLISGVHWPDTSTASRLGSGSRVADDAAEASGWTASGFRSADAFYRAQPPFTPGGVRVDPPLSRSTPPARPGQYALVILELECPDESALRVFASRNAHGVPLEGLMRQRAKMLDNHDPDAVMMPPFIEEAPPAAAATAATSSSSPLSTAGAGLLKASPGDGPALGGALLHSPFPQAGSFPQTPPLSPDSGARRHASMCDDCGDERDTSSSVSAPAVSPDSVDSDEGVAGSFGGLSLHPRVRTLTRVFDTVLTGEQLSLLAPRVLYFASFFSHGVHAEVTSRFPPAFPVIHASHVTVCHSPPRAVITPALLACLGAPMTLETDGRACSDRLAQAVLVRWARLPSAGIESSREMRLRGVLAGILRNGLSANDHPHVTVSTAAGTPAASSNFMLARNGGRFIPSPLVLQGTFGVCVSNVKWNVKKGRVTETGTRSILLSVQRVHKFCADLAQTMAAMGS